MTRRRRWALVVSFCAVLLVVALWAWPVEAPPAVVADDRPPQVTAAVPEAPPRLEAPPPAPTPAAAVATPSPAPVEAPPDAGPQLGGESLMRRSKEPGPAFSALCRSAGEKCSAEVVRRTASDGFGGFHLAVARQPGSEEYVVRDLIRFMGEASPWEDCLRAQLVNAVAPEPALQGEDTGWVQCLMAVPKAAFDFTEQVRRARERCLRPPGTTLKVTATLVLERTEVRTEDIVVVVPENADGFERRCVEQALTVRTRLPPDERYATPVRKPLTQSVSGAPVDGSGSVPGVKLTKSEGLKRLPQITPAHIAAQRFIDRAHALPRTSYDERLALLQGCVEKAPEFSECYVELGTTWAKKARGDHSPAALDAARTAYQRFVELASPEDSRLERVKQILAASGQP